MKKHARNAFRSLLVLVALILACLGVGVVEVDHRPGFTQPYYEATVARLHAQATNQSVIRGTLAAGFGKARLTPTLNGPGSDPVKGEFKSVPLAGYGNRRGRPATGAHDDLFVKAVALRVADRVGVIVSADALIIPGEVAEEAATRLRQELSLKREQIYFSATHTHCSLGGWGEGLVAESFAGGYQPGVRTWFAGQLVAAGRAAVADLTPASLGYGEFAAPEFVRNRLVGKRGKVDGGFSFLVVKKEHGEVAVVGRYGAHATVLPSSVMEFSGDYPGYWQRSVERATGGMAMFLAGPVGSQSPSPGAGGFAGAQRMGEALAHAVVERLPETRLTHEVAFGALGLEVGLPDLQVRVTDGWRLRPFLAKRLLPASSRTFLQAMRLGDSVWISTPCDFSGELALGIEDSLRVRGRPVAITSFNGDYLGYVIPARYYHLPGYEPRLMSFYGPNLPDYFDVLMREMALMVGQP